MEIIRQIGKNLKGTKKGSDFAIERVQRNFPVLEKVYDFLSGNHPFKMEFKTYFPDDEVHLTLQIKEDVIGVPARHICVANASPVFGSFSDYDVFGGRIGNPLSYFAPPTPPPSVQTTFGSHPPEFLSGDRAPNGGSSWGVGSRVYVGNGVLTHYAQVDFDLGSPKVICKLMVTNGSLFGFYTGEWTVFADGAPLLVPTENVLYNIDYVEAQVWSVQYYSTHTLPDAGFQYIFVGGSDIGGFLLWEAEFE